MSFTYWLPDENGAKIDYTTESNAVIIIGANGSGKSKLGAWIEQQNFDRIHRIGAQRNLNFNENISLKSYDQAESLVLWGTDKNDKFSKDRKFYRWTNTGKEQYTTTLLNDFENVLAALIALKNNENEEYISLCKEAEKEQIDKPSVPQTVIDKLQCVWNEVLPQRKLSLYDSKFNAYFFKDDTEIKYSANQMSDGERAVLYLTAQVLCVPNDKILIIDEPEIHLHRSIMNRLWKALEKYRPDCLFIYITHDTQFAAMHQHADKIWIKEYDGRNWKLEKLEANNLPEELLLDILGSRKNVLFVEGERDSYDTQLYSELYPDYYVVPCGSCNQVITRTKAFKNNSSLHEYNVFGIIDRDFRSDYEIEEYKKDNIFVLNVAEVENLFIVEPLIRFMAEHMGKDTDEVFQNVKDYVVNTRFKNQINSQICQSVVAQLKYKLTCAEISKKNESEAKSSLDKLFSEIDYESKKSQEETKFQNILISDNYADVIKVFNEKGIAKSVGNFFDIDNKAYCKTVIALLKGNKHDEIVETIIPYLPTEISR